MAQEELVFAFHNGIAFSFERAPRRTASAFGGPMADEVFGVACGPKPLHLIARLGCRHILALSSHYLSSVPLIYGMCYDACEMKYRIHSNSKIELLELKPAQSLGRLAVSGLSAAAALSAAPASQAAPVQLRRIRGRVPQHAGEAIGRSNRGGAAAGDFGHVVVGWR